MPQRTRPPANVGKDRESPIGTAPGDDSPDRRRAAAAEAAGGRVLERIHETFDSVARQMGARRRNLGRLDGDR